MRLPRWLTRWHRKVKPDPTWSTWQTIGATDDIPPAFQQPWAGPAADVIGDVRQAMTRAAAESESPFPDATT